MRALLLTTAFPESAAGDQVPWLLELALSLREAGVDLEVLAPAAGNRNGRTVCGVPVHRYRYSRRGTLGRAVNDMALLRTRPELVLPALSLAGAATLAAGRLLRRRSYAVVHSHWPLPNALFARLGATFAASRPRLFTTFHGAELSLARRHPPLRRLLARLVRSLDGAVANSSYTAGIVRELTGVEPHVIPLAAPRAAARPAARTVPETGGLPLVFAAGRLVERKGFGVLVRSAARLRGRARVVIAGDGEGRSTLEREIRASRVEDVVRLAGRLPGSALAAYYECCAVFCMPSTVDARGDTETLGVVAIEAMNHGKPVVASRVGGVPDVVEPGTTGLLVPPGDPKALAAALEALLRDPARARRLGAAGRERALERFSPATVARQHLELYRSAPER